MNPKRGFASDNNSGIHNKIIEAIRKANEGHCIAYGDDQFTETAVDRFKEHFGDDIDVYFLFTGIIMTIKHRFTGLGFGPIQGGLFVKEAFQSGHFERIVVSEIDQQLVDAVRSNGGSYFVNVARFDGIEVQQIDDIELLNPNVDTDRKILLQALYESTEITTSLPSVSIYDLGANSVASLIHQGLENSTTPATIVYTAENNNHAAEILGHIFESDIKYFHYG